MSEWEEWIMVGRKATEFPSLRCLQLRECPKLKGSLPNNLPSLTELEVFKRPLLELPHSDEVDYSKIKTFYIEYHLGPYMFPRIILSSNCLTWLKITNIPSLTSFPRDGLPTTLRFLTITDCEQLEFLPHESLPRYTSLEDLEIDNSCCSLASFPLGCFPVLKNLWIEGCKSLQSFSIAQDSSQSLSFLQSLNIRNCPNLESFPQGGLPTPNLIQFRVWDCEKLIHYLNQ